MDSLLPDIQQGQDHQNDPKTDKKHQDFHKYVLFGYLYAKRRA